MPKIDEYINLVLCGDAAEVLKDIPSDSIDLIITSPPYYQQRDYGMKGIGNEEKVENYVSN